MSFKSFKQNAGWTGILKVFVVGGVFTAIAVHFKGFAAAAWVLSWVLGWPLGRWVAAEPEKRSFYHRGLGYLMVFGSMALGQFRSSLNLADETLVPILAGVVGLYLSSYVALLSDPKIVINK